jgi:NAD+ kinase
MKAFTAGTTQEALAFNEVSLLRETRQAAKLRIVLDGESAPVRTRLRRHLSVHAGRQHGLQPFRARPHSSYRFSPLGDDAVEPFRPRRWRGALLPHLAQIRIDILEPKSAR